MGYFPCAPVHPTLAFDINLLEFVTIGSHHMAPNVTGWSGTIQYFLSIRGYLVGEKVYVFCARDLYDTDKSLGYNSTALGKCIALVSSSCCNGQPGG